jgi:hypothetical protein
MSNKCKALCIDENKNYCANSNFSGGYCCELDESTCPRADICSEDNAGAPAIFKYLACPNEAACETKNLYPKYDGTKLTRAVDKYTYNFVKDDVCSYIVHSPFEMVERDIMYLKISKIENCEVYVAKGKGFRWISHLDGMVGDGVVLDTRMGW